MTAPAQVMTPIQKAQEEADARRRARLQSGGQTPAYYSQQQEVFQGTLAPKDRAAVQAPASNIPQDVWSQRLKANTTIGQTQTAGVVGSIATQKARKAEADYKAWVDKNNKAIKDMQDKYNNWVKTIQGTYNNVPPTQYDPAHPNAGGGAGGGTGTPGVKAGQYIFSDSTDKKIADWARQAGWSESDIPQLIGIANGESSRNPLAINDKNSNGSTDYGLVQINTIHRGDAIMNDPRIGGASSFYEGGGWKDPIKNLIVAKSIHDAAGGWGDWVAFTTGNATYKPPYTVAKQDQPSIGLSTPTRGGTVASSPNGLRASVVQKGLTYQGTPYVYAGDSLTQGVDCSGLVHSLYQIFGITVPRVAALDARPQGGYSPRMGNLGSWESQGANVHGTITGWINHGSDLAKLAPGDLVTFYNGSSGVDNEFGHVAIYIGNGKILESPDVGLTVRVRSLRDDEISRGNYLRGIHLNLPGDGPDGR